MDLGVEMLISQLFFDNEMFYRFEEMTQIAGISVPIYAGIMPITTSKQLGTTVSLSGSSVPKKLADIIATYDDKPEDMRKAGIEYAVNQILDLKAHGVKDGHLYSMTKAKEPQLLGFFFYQLKSELSLFLSLVIRSFIVSEAGLFSNKT